MVHSRSKRIAVIGLGAIGGSLVSSLLGESESLGTLVGVLVRKGKQNGSRDRLPGVMVTDRLEELLAKKPDLVVECAGHPAVCALGPKVLSKGADLMMASSGALAHESVHDELRSAAAASGARILIPCGATAGLDGLGAMRAAGLREVSYESTKPPEAWRGTKAEELVDLDALSGRCIFFEGTAREAAIRFPENANVAATIALAGIGLDRTVVRLAADSGVHGNSSRIHARSRIGRMSIEMQAESSGNPRTSASAAFGILNAIRRESAVLVL
jgi:aspartate dehydrogenase